MKLPDNKEQIAWLIADMLGLEPYVHKIGYVATEYCCEKFNPYESSVMVDLMEKLKIGVKHHSHKDHNKWSAMLEEDYNIIRGHTPQQAIVSCAIATLGDFVELPEELCNA